MGKGNRGFKPQGMVNPIMMARLSRPVQTGPTIRDRLEREGRPSWDEVKKVVVKKEKAASDFLEQWENDHYREELEVHYCSILIFFVLNTRNVNRTRQYFCI